MRDEIVSGPDEHDRVRPSKEIELSERAIGEVPGTPVKGVVVNKADAFPEEDDFEA